MAELEREVGHHHPPAEAEMVHACGAPLWQLLVHAHLGAMHSPLSRHLDLMRWRCARQYTLRDAMLMLVVLSTRTCSSDGRLAGACPQHQQATLLGHSAPISRHISGRFSFSWFEAVVNLQCVREFAPQVFQYDGQSPCVKQGSQTVSWQSSQADSRITGGAVHPFKCTQCCGQTAWATVPLPAKVMRPRTSPVLVVLQNSKTPRSKGRIINSAQRTTRHAANKQVPCRR